MHLIVRARELYATEPLGIDLDATVYALDATTIDLCLSLFDWAPFRSTNSAVKVRTLLDLRGAIPEFIHMARGQPRLDFRGLYKLQQTGAYFATRAKRRTG